MTGLPAEAITAAAVAIHRLACPVHDDDVEPQDVRYAKAALEAAAPHIRAQAAAAERARLAAVISPDQFRKLAEWFDTDDEFKEAMFPETWSPGSRKDEVQQDLRRFADLLREDTPPAADPTTENEGFRAWKAGFATGHAEEREAIIQLASQLRATIPAGHPPGAQASFADCLRVTGSERRIAAGLLREDTP